jgi:copper resistance protein B
MHRDGLVLAFALASACLLGIERAAAQDTAPHAHEGHGAASRPATHGAIEGAGPLLPHGKTLDEVLEGAAKPPPAAFGKPIDDDPVLSFTQFELLEYRIADSGRDQFGWDAQGWIGSDRHKFWWKTEGDAVFDGPDEGDADLQLLYARPLSAFWYFQIGARMEESWEPDSTRETFAGVLGVQGIAPFQIDMEPTLFITDDGDVLPQLTASYYLYLTQRVVLQPRMELNASFQDIPESGVGAGLTDGRFDLRLLYEIRREFAPYVGVRYHALFGETAGIAEQEGREKHDWLFLVGARITF